MKLTALAALILFVVPVRVRSQEHAVLPEQCRADIRLWKSQSKDENNKLSYSELGRRGGEAFDCLSIDSGTGESIHDYQQDTANYQIMVSVYVFLQGDRLKHFVERHDLNEQFLKEDAAGAR